MNKEQKAIINGLAEEAKKGGDSFTELYNMVQVEFSGVVESYLIKNNLTGFNFERADYISALGQALWESLKGFDSSKGDFMARFVLFGRYRMKGITDYNLASKRFDKSKQTVGFEELFESEEFDLADVEASDNDVVGLIGEFIRNDKEGRIIEVLLTTTDTKVRNSYFTAMFGKYEATERKKVQRARQRLQAYLTSNGVFI